MIYRISGWSPATSWLHSQRSWHDLQRQRLQCSVATFPFPHQLPCVPLPQRHSLCVHIPLLKLLLVQTKAVFTARAKASAGGFTSTTIITPLGTCQLLCSVVIKTSALEIQGGFPSVSALLCVGRSLIHVSVLQQSHDRWVGWSEIQDVVTHEIVPAAQGCHSLSQHPKLCPRLLLSVQHLQRWGCRFAAAWPKSCTMTLWHFLRGSRGCRSPLHSNSKEWEAITGDSCLLREHKQSSPV